MQWTILTGKSILVDKQLRPKKKPFEGYQHCYISAKMNTERPACRPACRILKLSYSTLYISSLHRYTVMGAHSWCSVEVLQEAMLSKCTCEHHNLFTIVSENISIMKTPLLRDTSPRAKKQTIKASKLYWKATLQICTYSKHSTLENANSPSTPEDNAANWQTFCFNDYSRETPYAMILAH